MRFSDYAKYDGLGLAELVRQKDVTAAELVETAIVRAEEVNPKLNFMVYRDFERARAAAVQDEPRGTFAGVPFFLKDILAFCAGMPTRQGARFTGPVRPGGPGAWSCCATSPGPWSPTPGP